MGNGQAVQVDAESVANETHFTADEVNELLDEFRKVSPNLSPISQEKFGKLCVRMAERYPNSVYSDPKWRQVVFSYSDADHSKTVDVQEAIACLSVMTRGTLEEKARLVFTAFDKDGNGSLSKAEVQRGFETSFASIQAAMAEAVHAAKDELKKEGMPGFMVNLAFKAFSPKLLFTAWIQVSVEQFFAEVDADSNGAISLEEFVSAAKAQEGTEGPMSLLLNPMSDEARATIEKAAELRM